jgi:hypothetical protein
LKRLETFIKEEGLIKPRGFTCGKQNSLLILSLILEARHSPNYGLGHLCANPGSRDGLMGGACPGLLAMEL